MAYAQIRAAVASILSSVPGMGVVHQYERHAADWDKFLSLFRHQDKINGCTITRRGVSAIRPARSVEDRNHRLLIRAYYGINDSAGSEHTFQALVDAVLDDFPDEVLIEETVYDFGPVQVETIEPRLFGSVLCHYAELALDASVRIG